MNSSDVSYCIELWENCSTGCPICYHLSKNKLKPNFLLNKYEMHKAVEDLKRLISNIQEPEKIDIFLYGGELLEYNIFNNLELGKFISNYMDKLILNFKIAAGLVTTKMEYLEEFLSQFTSSQYEYIAILTSWDPERLRFRTDNEETEFFKKIAYLKNKYIGLKFQINITLTNVFCRLMVDGKIDLDKILTHTDWPLSFTLFHEGDFKYSPTLQELVECLEYIGNKWGDNIVSHFVNHAGCTGDHHKLYMYDKKLEKLTFRDKAPADYYLPVLSCGHFNFNKWVIDFKGDCIYCELIKIYNTMLTNIIK